MAFEKAAVGAGADGLAKYVPHSTVTDLCFAVRGLKNPHTGEGEDGKPSAQTINRAIGHLHSHQNSNGGEMNNLYGALMNNAHLREHLNSPDGEFSLRQLHDLANGAYASPIVKDTARQILNFAQLGPSAAIAKPLRTLE